MADTPVGWWQVLSVFVLELLARIIALGSLFWVPFRDCRWNYFEVMSGLWTGKGQVHWWRQTGGEVGLLLVVILRELIVKICELLRKKCNYCS